MMKAYCVELKKEFVIGMDLPENYYDYTWECPHCGWEVELLEYENPRGPVFGQWIHLKYNEDCPMLQKEQWDY